MTADVDEFYRYLGVVRLYPGSILKSITVASKIYMMFHRDAGSYYPTFEEGFQVELCKPEIQEKLMADDYTSIALDRLVILHSRWIAKKLAETFISKESAAEDDTTEYSKFEGYATEGSWLEDFAEEEE